MVRFLGMAMLGSYSCGVDDLPVIRESIKKGFLETQKTVNSFITNLKKKIDGDDEPSQPTPQGQNYRGGYPQQAFSGRRSGEYGRRSADRERYDADPQVLGDDFTGLQLRDEEGVAAPSASLLGDIRD